MMIKAKLLGAAAILLLGAGTAAAAPAVARSDLNVRSGPGTNYGVVGVIQSGETVDVGSCDGGWCQVAFDGGNGFASRSYLQIAGGAPSAGVVVQGPAYDPYGYDDDFGYGYGYTYGPGVSFYAGPRFHRHDGWRRHGGWHGRNWQRGERTGNWQGRDRGQWQARDRGPRMGDGPRMGGGAQPGSVERSGGARVSAPVGMPSGSGGGGPAAGGGAPSAPAAAGGPEAAPRR